MNKEDFFFISLYAFSWRLLKSFPSKSYLVNSSTVVPLWRQPGNCICMKLSMTICNMTSNFEAFWQIIHMLSLGFHIAFSWQSPNLFYVTLAIIKLNEMKSLRGGLFISYLSLCMLHNFHAFLLEFKFIPVDCISIRI